MTETATVTRHMTTRPVAGAMKAGGAGAPTGPVDALEGAFAAMMDAAQGLVPGEGASVAASKDGVQDGKVTVLKIGAEQPGVATDVAGTIQLMPNVKTADAAPAGAPVPLNPVAAASADAALGDAGDVSDVPAKPRKGNARASSDELAPSDPALAQAGLQLVASMAAPVQSPPIEQPTAKTKAVLSIDADATGGSDVKARIALPLVAKQAEETAKAADAPTAPLVDARAAVPVKADAPAALAAQAGNVPTQTRDDAQPDTQGRDRDERGSGRLAALKASADAANDDASTSAAVDPFQDILQSLPPVVQSQLGVQPAAVLGTDAPAAVTATASTGDLLGNQVIDMGVSGQWIDRMAREIAALSEGTGHSRFQLMPPNLGRIQVDMWQGDDKTNVRLLTETDEAARRLREGQGALEASARLASLSLGTVNVEKSSDSFDSPRDQSQNQRQQAQNDFGNGDQQQASAQAQGQSGQGRGNTGPNRNGSAAVIGFERQAEPEQSVRAPRADDPRVRFA